MRREDLAVGMTVWIGTVSRKEPTWYKPVKVRWIQEDRGVVEVRCPETKTDYERTYDMVFTETEVELLKAVGGQL